MFLGSNISVGNRAIWAAAGAPSTGSLLDKSGKGHVLSLAGDTALALDPADSGNWVISMDGTGDYFSTAYDSDFIFTNLTTWTMSFLVRFNTVASSQNICEKTDGDATAEGFQLYYHAGSGAIRFIADQAVIQGTTSISADTWYHVVVTCDGGTMRLYVDSNLEDSLTGVLTNYTGDMKFGVQTLGLQLYMNGYQDNINISQGIVRSAAISDIILDAYTVLALDFE